MKKQLKKVFFTTLTDSKNIQFSHTFGREEIKTRIDISGFAFVATSN